MHTAVNLVDEIVNFILLQIDEHWDEVEQSDAAIRFFAQIKNNLCAGSKIPVDSLLLVNLISSVGIYLEKKHFASNCGSHAVRLAVLGLAEYVVK